MSTAGVIAAVAVGAVAVLGSIGSILLLAFRTGRLVGAVERESKSSADNTARIFGELGRLAQSAERHIEVFHGGSHVHR